MRARPQARDLAYAGLLGAAALLLPLVFHVLRLGHVFMPMYLPLVTLAFFVRPAAAAATAFVVPLLSGALTGMPPFYPPVAGLMSLELAAMAAVISAVISRRPRANEWLVLAPVLLLGRALYMGLAYAVNLAIGLPAAFLAGLSVLGGWPGLVLMLVAVPPVARLRNGHVPATAGEDARTAYFDSIAERWDGWEDLPALEARLAAGLERLGVGPDDRVLDAGCGTGNLTRALLDRLSGSGRVLAVDLSPRMIDEARRKVLDPRADWLVADLRRLPVPEASFDRVICFSVWPHLDDRAGAAGEIFRVLKPGGRLDIWHLDSRAKINAVHTGVGGAIGGDLLPPAGETAGLLRQHGFRPVALADDEDGYLVAAVREDRASDDACALA
ncbi:MAG TPA: class I SAM-dependent methyltransferase [Candidatus Aminicenantes bacterium]|nr:class I SAM-dependent methyltransferase [Candidatus Aminicenantes bacterium]HRY65170.1 class I SAM-dependent methyltransferase [Candidatus Aminicenantes bacterium]HRZ72362.1 class I SAM-dependent methyltransferase [Candidatus Aminicenantes bacterium]